MGRTPAQLAVYTLLRNRARRRTQVLARFFRHIGLSSDPDGCWFWLLAPHDDGYGIFHVKGKNVRAHRFSYEYFYGKKVPKKYLVDHKCQNRLCVRPDHIRAVTPKINTIENSSGPAFDNHRKVLCVKGHLLNYTRPDGSGRGCRACRDTVNRRRYKHDN